MKFSNLVRTLFFLASSRSTVTDDPGAGPGGPDVTGGPGDMEVVSDEAEYGALLDAPTTLWSAQLFPDIELELS